MICCEPTMRGQPSAFCPSMKAATTHQEDFVMPYVNDLKNVVDMDAFVRGLNLGVDPLGGAARLTGSNHPFTDSTSRSSIR